MLEAICWDKISDLFLYLADYALQERFVAFAVTMTAYQVKPDPFWKIVRPTGVPDGVVVGSFVTSGTYTTCFTGVVVPYVCTSGSKICGK